MARGYEGWLAILPETDGWGSRAFGIGNYLFADQESLGVNKEFTSRPDKITYGRNLKGSSRSSGAQKPGGELTYQFRSEDAVPVLMGHFQKYVGTELGATSGTAVYTFVPSKGEPDWIGSTWGTGGYTSSTGDMFTFGMVKKYFNTSEYDGTNAMHFYSGICDSLTFQAKAGEDAKIVAGLKFYGVTSGTAIGAALDPSNSTYGSYSVLPMFEYFSGTVTYAGASIDLTSLEIKSLNNLAERMAIGKINPTKYPFGRNMIEGSMELEWPKDGVKYIGSMLADRGFAITATFYNSANDAVYIGLPNCRYKPFDVNLAGAQDTTFSIPWEAFESEDGSTSPITVAVRTQNWTGVLTKRL